MKFAIRSIYFPTAFLCEFHFYDITVYELSSDIEHIKLFDTKDLAEKVATAYDICYDDVTVVEVDQ